MALMSKIQSLGSDGQRQILALYSEDNAEYMFPIELRNIFADVIENAICGRNCNSVDGGLDPKNPAHNESIVKFLSSLITLLEDRLGNSQSGDQFFVKHKLSETLANFKEKKLTDPLGLFDHMRNKLKAEIGLIAQEEAAKSNMQKYERDIIIENINFLKTQLLATGTILQDIRTNEENFGLNCNEKQRLEGIQSNPEQFQLVLQQYPDGEARVRANLATVEGYIEQNIRNLQLLIQRFEQNMQSNLQNIAVLEGQIINEKLAIWKHEQQLMANKIVDRKGQPIRQHSVTLDKLQIWCEELAELIWKSYDQLKEAERILQNGLIRTGNDGHLTFVQGRIEDVRIMLERLLNQSFVVEEQPPQIIKMKTKFPKSVVVRLLVGKRLNIHFDNCVKTEIISEEQVQTLNVSERIENIGEITNGVQPMEAKDKKLVVTFKSLQLKQIKRTERRGSGPVSERVMEEKACLYFETQAILGSLAFKLSTISLPVVVISHGSQEALALAAISWDNAFGEIGRQPFRVPQVAPWAEVAQILNAKFFEVAGRGLTEENLQCLAQKAFRHRTPQPETISWSELCRENLPDRNFTFWSWFHAALKIIEKKECHLTELWKEGLIYGFIERDAAERLISNMEPGTFLLRFADSIQGAITIALLVNKNTVVSLQPYQQLGLQTQHLARSIKDLDKVKYLFKPPNELVHKDIAFGKYYEKDTATTPGDTKNPYVKPIQTIPDGSGDIVASGSATPQPMYDGSRRSSDGLSAQSPIPLEPAHSPNPFFTSLSNPQSPLSQASISTFHDMQNGSPRQSTMIMDTTMMHNSPSTSASLSHIQSAVPVMSPSHSSQQSASGSLDTPRPVSNQIFQYSNTAEMFDDLIRVIRSDAEETMEVTL